MNIDPRSLNAPLMVPNGAMKDPLRIAEEELNQNKARCGKKKKKCDAAHFVDCCCGWLGSPPD